jgi:hypothetical protein
MQEPLEVIYRHLDGSPQLDDFIQKHVEKFDHIFDRITSCQLVIEKAQKSVLPGGLYKVRISILMPRRHNMVVKKEANINGTFQKLSLLIGSALKAAIREVEKIKEKEFSTSTRTGL